MRKRPAARLTTLLEHLSNGIRGTFEARQGSDRFENPSLGGLREVLDAVLAEHPAAGVRCTLAWVEATNSALQSSRSGKRRARAAVVPIQWTVGRRPSRWKWEEH